jgi:type VI secretion system secreted protein Hcp
VISAYLKLSGERVKDIKGPVRDPDETKNGSIALLAVEHSIVSPRHPATGMATGKRQHHPITVTKETDNTSPHFYEFIAQNVVIPAVELFFFGTANRGGLVSGREENLYKITLNKASVSRIDLAAHTDEEAKDSDRLPLRERISFVYDSIHWEWANPRAMTDDIYSSKE